MRGEFRNIVSVACIYMATIIGAGFASGQEIVRFFSTYYSGGYYGIIVSGLLFSVIGYIVLDKVYRERIRNYDELIFPMVGWVMGWVMEIIVTLFMLCIFCVMVAGMGNIVSERSGISLNVALGIVSVVCLMVMLTDIKGVVAISTIVTPIMIFGIIITGLYVIVFKDTSVFSLNCYLLDKATDNWLFSALTYVSYNSIMSMVVMSSLLPYLKSRRVGIAGGIAGGLMLCFIAMIINSAIFIFYPEVMAKELPMLDIVGKYSSVLTVIYTLVLVLAMFVSAITSGYYFIERISSKLKINIKAITVITCAMAIPLSGFGFSNIIATVYPIFGYVGMFAVFAVLIQGIKLRPISKYVRLKRKL